MKRLILQLGFSLAAFLIFLPSVVHATDTNVTVSIEPAFYVKLTGDLDFYIQPGDFLEQPGYVRPPGWKPGDDVASYQNMEAPTDYGWSELKSVFVDVWANTAWQVKVKGIGGDYFTGGPWAKPVSDILWQDGIPSGWHHLSLEDQYVNKWVYNPSKPGYHRQLSVGFRILLDWSKDVKGFYTYDCVQFTAMAYP